MNFTKIWMVEVSVFIQNKIILGKEKLVGFFWVEKNYL